MAKLNPTKLAQELANIIAKHNQGMRRWTGENDQPMASIGIPPNLIEKIEAAQEKLVGTGVFPLLSFRGKKNEKMMARIISISTKIGSAIAAIEELETVRFQAGVQDMSGDEVTDLTSMFDDADDEVIPSDIKDEKLEKARKKAEAKVGADNDLETFFDED